MRTDGVDAESLDIEQSIYFNEHFAILLYHFAGATSGHSEINISRVTSALVQC